MSTTTPFATAKGKNLSITNTTPVIIPGKCVVFSVQYKNRSGSTRYLKLYDKATDPTSSDVQFHTIEIAAGEASAIAIMAFMNAGFGMRATTGLADNDNGAPSANDVMVNWTANT